MPAKAQVRDVPAVASRLDPSTACDAGVPVSACEQARIMLEKLSVLQLPSFLNVGEQVTAERSGLSSRVLAGATLDATIVDRGLRFEAWFVSDHVDTLFCQVRPANLRLSRRDSQCLATAKRIVRNGALAILSREYLTGDDYDMLCEWTNRLLDSIVGSSP